jgi:hypothetical protein
MARVELLVTVDKIVSSNLQPVSGASVLVKLRSTGNPVTVYAAETGGTTVSNPLVTDANGRVNGWVDEASLVLTISGSGITSYNQPYEAINAQEFITINGNRMIVNSLSGTAITDNSIPNTKLGTGAVLPKHLSDAALPLGVILPWWQPTKPGGGFVIPTGWALCNGQTLVAPNHDFAGGGSVVLPNLIDKTLRGADPSFAQGAAAGVGTAPGMNGAAGANTLNLAHTHTLAHTHSIATHSHQVQDHSHWMAHSHSAWVPDHAHGVPTDKFQRGGSNTGLSMNGSGTYGFGGVGIGTDGGNRNSTDGSGAISTINQSGGTVTGAESNGTTSSTLSATQDIRNLSVGVLYIMKVRNTV